MRRMKRCRCGAGYPGAICTRFRMADLLFEHIRHQIRHGPHTLTNLRFALKAALETNINVPVFVGGDPCSLFHIAFTDHWTRFHRCMNLVSGAIKEARIDENHALLGGAYAFFQIHRCAALFVHNPHFHGIACHARNVFCGCKNLRRKRHFFRTVHFWLHNIHRALCGIPAASGNVGVTSIVG